MKKNNERSPKLRFSGFESEWQVKHFNDYLDSVSSGKSSTINNDSGEYPIYGSTGEIGLSLDYDYAGDKILIARVGANAGSIYRVNGNYNISDNTLVVNLQNNLSTDFAFYLLHKFNLNRLVFGSGQPLITGGQLKKIKISVPVLDEQQKIANFLTAVDDKISELDKKVTVLKQYKKGVMQKVFSQQIRFRNENGDFYPDWKNLKLNEIFNEICQKVGDSNAQTYSITAGKGFISQAKKFGKNISGSQNKNYILLKRGDFSYNKGNSKTYKYGCVYANNLDKQIAVPNVFISFRMKFPNMSVGYFEQLFTNHYLDRYLIQIISSGARMDGLLNVNKESFFNIKTPTPSNEDQRKIANFLTAIDQKIAAEESKLKIAKEWKKGLLQRMFV